MGLRRPLPTVSTPGKHCAKFRNTVWLSGNDTQERSLIRLDAVLSLRATRTVEQRRRSHAT